MEGRYFIDITDAAFMSLNRTNAASKPREDVRRTATRCGFTPIIINSYFWKLGMPRTVTEKVQRKIHLASMWWQMRQLKRLHGAEILLQYPFLAPSMFKIIRQLKEQGCRLTILFHDFYTIREHRQNDEAELSLLRNADRIIVHTQEMADAFRSCGCTKPIELLHFFDYLNDFHPTEGRMSSDISIIYAGNLEKSRFVNELKSLPRHPDLHFLLYGKPELTGNEDDNGFIYKGFFNSEDIKALEGNWGLVWDGDSVNTCSGDFGEYLRINAPFKFSLYLAMGIPVIVWKQSAMAKYVAQHSLGICVESLDEVYDCIRHLSATDTARIREGVKKYSEKVRRGDMLGQLLSSDIH